MSQAIGPVGFHPQNLLQGAEESKRPLNRRLSVYMERRVFGVSGQAGGRSGYLGGGNCAGTAKQEAYRDLRLLLAIPFPEFADRFPPKQKERYQHIPEGCTDSVIVCWAHRPDAYKKRNCYMVDRSVCGIAVYDNDHSIRSGTGMTLNYAKNVIVRLF